MPEFTVSKLRAELIDPLRELQRDLESRANEMDLLDRDGKIPSHEIVLRFTMMINAIKDARLQLHEFDRKLQAAREGRLEVLEKKRLAAAAARSGNAEKRPRGRPRRS